MKKQTYSPWCEKYRPQQLEKIVLDPINRTLFQRVLETKQFPNLLFYGPPGTGKTTSAENIIQSYQERYYKKNKETIIHLNASDERGIEVIRSQIYQFVKTQNMFEKGLKFVILDEVDYMTKNAQQALKNLLQSCSPHIRFILICNYICKIEESLKNEFICIRFNQLPQSEMIQFIEHITKAENISIETKNIKRIQEMFHSDIRSMINFIQLHQGNMDEYLFHDYLFENLHQVFMKCGSQKEYDNIFQWFEENHIVSKTMDVNTWIKYFFRYMIRHNIDFINSTFLNIAETIIHMNDVNVNILVSYFIHQMCENVYFVQNPNSEKILRKIEKKT